MNSNLNVKIESPEKRAQELVSYLEKKTLLSDDIPHSFHPQSFKSEIEKIFNTAENTLKEIKEQK